MGNSKCANMKVTTPISEYSVCFSENQHLHIHLSFKIKMGCCVFIFIHFYANFDFFFDFFCDLLVIQQRVVQPPYGKDSDAGRDWGQEEKGMTEDEMAGWHHRLDGHEFE